MPLPLHIFEERYKVMIGECMSRDKPFGIVYYDGKQRHQVGCAAKVIQVAEIPRTKSGKIVELAVREVVHNRPVKNLGSLANPEALELYRDLPQLQT